MSRFVGIFLDDASRARLVTVCPPRCPRIFGEHVTICFEPTDEQCGALRDWASGMRLLVAPDIEIWTDRGQCVRVKPESLSIPASLRNRTPHITISMDKYTEPSYSTALLERASESNRLLTTCYQESVWRRLGDLYGTLKLCKSSRIVESL